MDRLFLDANVLFSAAYREGAGVAVLWALETATLISSTYAIEEARRNLGRREQKLRLEQLTLALHVVEAVSAPDFVISNVRLPGKDLPIIAGAITSNSTHLITGDVRHFGEYFGKRIKGVLILRPADYLRGARW